MPPRPDPIRARSFQFAPFVSVMKECFRLQPQELLSIVPPRCRFPLTREPSAHGSPPPHRMSGCRRRNTARPSAARCTEDNSVLCPDSLAHLTRSLLAAGCPDPAPPPATQCARQSLPHPSRHTPHSAPLFSLAGSQPTHPTCSPPPSQGAALRGRAACAAPPFATSSQPGIARRRRRHRRPRHPHRHPP